MCAARYLSSLALRSPVKSHSAARAAGTAIALSPGLRSICRPVSCVGSVERSPREIPRRAPRRREGRTPFDPEEASSAGRAERMCPGQGNQKRGDGQRLTGNINDRPNKSRAIVDLPRRNERPEERMAFGNSLAPVRWFAALPHTITRIASAISAVPVAACSARRVQGATNQRRMASSAVAHIA